MNDGMPEIDEAFDEEAWEYLYLYQPKIADSIQTRVSKGDTPEKIKRHIVRRYGINREDIATRCEAAARHLGTAK